MTENWTPERHMRGIIRERGYAAYDEEWDSEHVEQLVDEMISLFVAKTGILAKHFRRDGLEELARTCIDSVRGEPRDERS